MLVALRKQVQTGQRDTVPARVEDQAATLSRSPCKGAVSRQPGPAGATRGMKMLFGRFWPGP
jgi:hypothetical protein